jgi:hypothetical protein
VQDVLGKGKFWLLKRMSPVPFSVWSDISSKLSEENSMAVRGTEETI